MTSKHRHEKPGTPFPGGPAQWDEVSERPLSDPELTVDVEGFEGPLDLLLELARRQKVDLSKISILALAEQYLAFIEKVRKLRIELAADYLVMAAWLAYLKSRLLLPDLQNDTEGLSGEEMAAHLAFRLQRLEAMREAARRLSNRNRLGRDFFARGQPEAVIVEKRSRFSATLYDLLTAYASQRQRTVFSRVTIARRKVWSLQEARGVLMRFADGLVDWATLDALLIAWMPDGRIKTTALASSFAATLELVREGSLAMRQEKAYAPLYLKNTAANSAKLRVTGV